MTAHLKVHCDYKATVMGCLLVVVDLNLGNRSVTNDIESVIVALSRERDLHEYVFIYRDSERLYNLVMINPDGSFYDFAPISQWEPITDLYDVIEILKTNKELA